MCDVIKRHAAAAAAAAPSTRKDHANDGVAGGTLRFGFFRWSIKASAPSRFRDNAPAEGFGDPQCSPPAAAGLQIRLVILEEGKNNTV